MVLSPALVADGKYMSADPARGRNAQASLSPLLLQSSQLGNRSGGDIAAMTNNTPQNPGMLNCHIQPYVCAHVFIHMCLKVWNTRKGC